MSSVDERYPSECAFCKISAAYPAGATPVPPSPDPDKVFPQCHLVLSTPHVLAFLDILPIAPGHLLLVTRDHHRTLADADADADAHGTARELGRWLPVLSRALCRVTGVEDWNVVQNNGARAAQVVPHVHFHLIPRYQEGRRETGKGMVEGKMLKSWTMFGRGAREELDDDEGAELAKLFRDALEREIGDDTTKSKI